MLLTIDVGNTNTVLGVFDGSRLLVHWRLTTRREQTADEYGILVRNLFTSSNIEQGAVDSVALASVVPPLTPVIVALARSAIGHDPLVVGPGVKTGMPILYEPPGDVGADRIVNGVAAFAAFGGPVVIVDFGTATTFDVVTRKGEYVGGVICPGVGISADALFQRAARLPRVDVRHPGKVIGRSTVTSMQSGLYFGYAAMCEGILARIAAELGEKPRVVATGGLAETLAAEVPSIEAVDPILTLTGLRLIWERESAGSAVSAVTSRDPEAEYYQSVEEYFVSRRGDPLMLSNADWTLVRKWRLAGLPLRVVLRGIRDALDAHALGWSRGRKVGSLAYCAREVETARERWERALGAGADLGGEAKTALAGFADDLEKASGLGPRARSLASELARELRDRGPAEGLAQLTALLSRSEARLVAAISEEEAPELRSAREAEVAAALDPWRARMPARVLEQLRQESLARRILEAHGLPRLSLFHLEAGGAS